MRYAKFIKQQEAKGLLSNLGLRTPLNKIPVLGDILFSYNSKDEYLLFSM